jgi:hypothetical protein
MNQERTDQIVLKVPDWEELKKIVVQAIKENVKYEEKHFLKSAETRRMLGGISAAKLQTLRVGGHLPAINADGLWLYDVNDIISFTMKNKINAEEGKRHE